MLSYLFRRASIAAAILLLFGLLDRAHAGAGTSGGNILSIGVGARAIGMGEAYTAQADDISSIYWNPAGIAILNQSQASFMYIQQFQETSYSHGAVATPLENGGVGGSIDYQSFGSIRGMDSHANPTGDVSAYGAVGTVSGALFAGPWAGGVSMKGVQSKLADVTARGVAWDVGGMWVCQRPVFNGTFRLGATMRNLGTGLKFLDQRDPFPYEYRFGAALVQMLDKKLNASLDVGKQRDVRPGVYSGVEYWVIPNLALRGGYVGTSQEGMGLRMGVGLRIKDISFDYAYSSYGDLGMSHLYEVVFRFGVIRPALTPEEREILRKGKIAMAHDDYDRATLLFSSLADMEPHYRPVRRLLKTAMMGVEQQERLANAPPNLQQLFPSLEDDPEVREIADLFNESKEAEKLAALRDTAQPNAESNTLAPYIPSSAAPTPTDGEKQGPAHE